MNIVNTKVGAEGQVSVDLEGGVLKVKGTEETQGLKLSLVVEAPLTYYLDAGAQKLNSPLMSALVGVLDGVIKQIP